MKINQTEKQEKKELYIGYGEFTVESLNPDKSQIIKMLNIDEANEDKIKEPEYLSEKDGVNQVRLDFWVRSVKTKNLDKVTFFIKQEERKNKDQSKTQYLNQTGDLAWSDVPENLFESFSGFVKINDWVKDGEVTEKYVKGSKPNSTEVYAKKTFRPAYVGEEELYHFLKNWLLSVDYRAEDTDIMVDTKKIFSGNFKELQSLIKTDSVGNVVGCYGVKVTESDNGVKEYQSISNKYFTQAPNMKLIRNMKFDQDSLQNIANKVESKSATPLEKFIYNSAISEYKIKDFFIAGDLTPYVEGMNPVTLSNSTIISDSGSDY